MQFADLFCGTGGMSLGLKQAGFKPVIAIDNFPTALANYNRNIAEHAINTDLNDVDAVTEILSPYAPDIISGGPPCQDFSTAGKRIEGDKASLTMAFARIITQARPRFFIMENVPRALTSNTFAAAAEHWRNNGYSIAHTVLNAVYYNVPQLRKRLFVFGWRDGKDRAPAFQNTLAKQQPAMTVRDHIPDIEVNHYYRHARNYSRRSIFSVDEPSPTIRTVNRPVPPGYAGHRTDSAKPHEVKPLTTVQRARIQTFPENWDWELPHDRDAKTETCIGNAVPVNLAYAVGKAVLAAS